MLHQGPFHHTLDNYYLPILPSYWQINPSELLRNPSPLNRPSDMDSRPTPTPKGRPQRQSMTSSGSELRVDSGGVVHFSGYTPTHERTIMRDRMDQEGEGSGQATLKSKEPQTQSRRNGSDGDRPRQILAHYGSPLKKSSTTGIMLPPQSRPRAHALSTASPRVSPTPHQTSHRSSASTSGLKKSSAQGLISPPQIRTRTKALPSSISTSSFASPTARRKSHQPSASTSSSSRRLSAGFTSGGPLTSNPTTAYAAITASTGFSSSRPATHGTLTKSNTLTNLPTSSHPDSRRHPPISNLSSKASMATTYTAATALPQARRENIPSSTSHARLTRAPPISLDAAAAKLVPKMTRTNPAQKDKTDERPPGIPKSRTFGVFSNITNSFSRSSLASFTRTASRNPSMSTTTTEANKPSNPIVAETRARTSTSSSTTFTTKSTTRITDPRKVYTAQSSAYWAGRFVSLNDKLRSEMLLPENFSSLISINKGESQVPGSKASKAPSGIPMSATSACLPTPHDTKPSGSGGSTIRAFSYQPKQQQSVDDSKKTSLDYKLTSSTTMKPISSDTRSTDTTTAMKAPLQPASRQSPDAKQKQRQSYGNDDGDDMDEDEKETHILKTMYNDTYRNKCVFQRLEALCATSEARRSLHAWQQEYARRHDCEELLPKGGSMEDRERGWVGRLLGGSTGGGIGMDVGASVAGRRTSVPVSGSGGGGRGRERGAGAGAGAGASQGYRHAKRESFAL